MLMRPLEVKCHIKLKKWCFRSKSTLPQQSENYDIIKDAINSITGFDATQLNDESILNQIGLASIGMPLLIGAIRERMPVNVEMRLSDLSDVKTVGDLRRVVEGANARSQATGV